MLRRRCSEEDAYTRASGARDRPGGLFTLAHTIPGVALLFNSGDTKTLLLLYKTLVPIFYPGSRISDQGVKYLGIGMLSNYHEGQEIVVKQLVFTLSMYFGLLDLMTQNLLSLTWIKMMLPLLGFLSCHACESEARYSSRRQKKMHNERSWYRSMPRVTSTGV